MMHWAKNKYFVKSAVAIGALVILTIIFWKNHHSDQSQSAAVKPTSVRVISAHQETLPVTDVSTGYLQAKNNTTITARVSGYIHAIPVHDGDTIKAGQTLFQLDNEKEQDALSAATANYQLSQLQYRRNQQLFKKGFITQDTYYTSLVTMKQNEAALQTAKTNLSDKTIIAPFDGTLGAISANRGDYINPGTALTQLVDNQHLRVQYTLPVKDLDHIHLNQRVTVKGENASNDVTGKITFISPTVDQATQTIAVQAELDNNTSLRPGEFVSVTQQIGNDSNIIAIPEQSVLGSMSGYSVYLVENNKAIEKPITIGKHQNGLVTVISGLKAKDQVVIAGQDQLQNGQPVIIVH